MFINVSVYYFLWLVVREKTGMQDFFITYLFTFIFVYLGKFYGEKIAIRDRKASGENFKIFIRPYYLIIYICLSIYLFLVNRQQ